MKFAAAVSVAAVAVGVQAQGVAQGSLVPSTPAPAGCITTGEGSYQVTVVKPSVAAKRSLEKRIACDASSNALIFTLKDGMLTDNKGRVGAIVNNRQFQFDGPPAQTGSIYTGGFSICANSSLAIGGTTEFFSCGSGGFSNLYDQSTGAQCSPVRLNTLKCDGAAAPGASSVASASQLPDGQPQATSATIVSQQTDGQPTAGTATSIATQISDGQIQAPTSAPVVSQISDGQIQATSASNATMTSPKPTAPIATGAAVAVAGSGAVAGVVAIAAFFM